MRIRRFLERIRLPGDTRIEISRDFLARVQASAVCSIAYENLDILAGVPLRLDRQSLYEKIVENGRGGYCFELNGLMAHMLSEMGFCVSERFARFLRGESDIPMRRHRVVIVSLPDGDYLVDIGVGQIAPRFPLKIQEGLVQKENGEVYRFERDPAHGWVLNELHKGAWRRYICFTDDPAYEADFLQPSFFCEKHPDSVFNKQAMLAIKTASGRKTLDGNVFKVFAGENLVRMEDAVSGDRLRFILAEEFLLKNCPEW